MTALDEVLAAYFAWEQQDYNETVQAVLARYEDVKLGVPGHPKKSMTHCAKDLAFEVKYTARTRSSQNLLIP